MGLFPSLETTHISRSVKPDWAYVTFGQSETSKDTPTVSLVSRTQCHVEEEDRLGRRYPYVEISWVINYRTEDWDRVLDEGTLGLDSVPHFLFSSLMFISDEKVPEFLSFILPSLWFPFFKPGDSKEGIVCVLTCVRSTKMELTSWGPPFVSIIDPLIKKSKSYFYTRVF